MADMASAEGFSQANVQRKGFLMLYARAILVREA